MGEFKLRLPRFWDFQPRHARTVHVIGLDGIPWQCRVQQTDDLLTITHHRDESGKIHIVWPFKYYGELLVQTGTLPERDTPWPLALELARGTLNRLRNQISIWQEGGLQIPSVVETNRHSATQLLGLAIFCSDPDRQDELASNALETANHTIFELCDTLATQVIQYRIAASDSAPFWMGAATSRIETAPPINNDPTFDLIGIQNVHERTDVVSQRDDGASRFEKPIIFGPLLDASPGGLPSDAIHADDFDNRKRILLKRCHEELEQLPEETSLIHVACGLNGIGHRHLNYHQQMQVTADLLRMVGDHPADRPAMVSIDYPWAERLAWSVGGTHPLQVADSLLRQALPIRYLGLDINLDYWPQGSIARDPLQWIDLLDNWSQFGLPLILCLRFPRATPGTDTPDTRSNDPRSNDQNSIREGLSAEQRQTYLETVLPMMIARPQVHGMIFRQAFDADDLRFPHGGLASPASDSPIAPAWLARIRQTFWPRT